MGKIKNPCPGSGTEIAVDWEPDSDGYPGAGVCPKCSGGILMVKGTLRKGISGAGYERLFGKLRQHKRAEG